MGFKEGQKSNIDTFKRYWGSSCIRKYLLDFVHKLA